MRRRGNKITAATGKVLRRISDGSIVGNEVYLGNVYYLNNKRLDEPIQELPKHYEEIDEPVTEETILLDEQTDLVEEIPTVTIMAMNQAPELRRVTIGDYMKLEEELREIKRILGLQ